MAKHKETKRERFVRVAEMRTEKVLCDLRSLANCSSAATYEYDEKDLEKIFGAIEKSVQECKDIFAGKHRFTLSRTDL